MNRIHKTLVAAGAIVVLTLAGIEAANAAGDPGSSADTLLSATDASGVVPDSRSAAEAQEATAKVERSSNPRAAFVALSVRERKLFKAYNVTAEVVSEEGTPVPLDAEAGRSLAHARSTGLTITTASVVHPRAGVPATGCWSVPGGLTGLNSVGGALWKITHSHKLCVTSRKVTSATYESTSGQALFMGWRWVKLDAKATGVVNGQSRQYVQHKFALGVNGWDIQVVDPCSRSAGTADGNVIPSTSCNITLG